MSSLLVLALSAAIPWAGCTTLGALLLVDGTGAARERSLADFRRAVLIMGAAVIPMAAVAGALLVDPVLSTRWPVTGSWFFASLSAMTASASLCLAQRTEDEAAAMTRIETIGRAVQMSIVPAVAVGLSLLSFSAARALLEGAPVLSALIAVLLSIASVLFGAPWLAMRLGLWRVFPFGIETERGSWRLAHLPAPTPFFTHAAALPWLRTALVSDGLFNRTPDRQWRTLVRYEISGVLGSRVDRTSRWAISMPLSFTLFWAAGAIGTGDPRKLVAGTVLAVLFTGAAAWIANRQPSSRLDLDLEGPSMQELAQTLRSLPPRRGQALPRTSLRPLGTPLYDRLFALGHDPGRRPHA